jgi:hypothetical protein
MASFFGCEVEDVVTGIMFHREKLDLCDVEL